MPQTFRKGLLVGLKLIYCTSIEKLTTFYYSISLCLQGGLSWFWKIVRFVWIFWD